jgi:glycosyltransferase involved in cell wall biosynthesis
MHKLLAVAYYFPPAGGAGVQRTTKFVKYLPQFGWQPIILTVKEKHFPLTDSSLLAELPAELTIQSTPALLLPGWLPWRLRRLISRWLLLVDDQIGWYPFAVMAGLKLVKKAQPQAIYTTSAPYTSHLIGKALKKHTGLPWIADFRDPWVGNSSLSFPTRLHEQITRQFEQSVLHQADRILIVSEPMREVFLTRYPDLPPGKVITLSNGYDPEDFHNLEPPSLQRERWLIVYNGSFYGSQRTPRFFLEGLKLAFDGGLLPRDKVKLRFIGNIGLELNEIAARLRLQDNIELTGYLPHRQSIAHLKEGDLLLLVVGSGPGSQAVMTGKIFEYLAADRPILALAPAGAAADLIQEARSGYLVDPQDSQAIARQLVLLYQKWSRGELVYPSAGEGEARTEILNRFDRRQLTGKLAKLLDELTETHRATIATPGGEL